MFIWICKTLNLSNPRHLFEKVQWKSYKRYMRYFYSWDGKYMMFLSLGWKTMSIHAFDGWKHNANCWKTAGILEKRNVDILQICLYKTLIKRWILMTLMKLRLGFLCWTVLTFWNTKFNWVKIAWRHLLKSQKY